MTSGRIQDTNSALIARAMQEQGWPVAAMLSVGDDDGAIHDALDFLLARAEAVIATGGLGPTADDITTAAIARAFGLTLRMDESVLAHIRELFAETPARSGRKTTPSKPSSRRGRRSSRIPQERRPGLPCGGKEKSLRSFRAFPPRPGGCSPKGLFRCSERHFRRRHSTWRHPPSSSSGFQRRRWTRRWPMRIWRASVSAWASTRIFRKTTSSSRRGRRPRRRPGRNSVRRGRG